MNTGTFAQIAASVALHAGIAVAVSAFSSDGMQPQERVYRVTLAEFSAPATPAETSAPQQTYLPFEPGTPEPISPVAEPPKTIPKTPAGDKTLKSRKTATSSKPVEEAQPAAPERTASAIPDSSNGPVLNVGGLAAYEADAVDQRPAITRRALPEYPGKARRMNVQGKVFVRLVVDTDGRPRECGIHRAEPVGYFEDAALDAARRTLFIPGKVKGRAVNTVVLVPFVFALR